MLHRVRDKAEQDLANGLKEGVQDPKLGMLQDNLTKQFIKLHSMDHFHTIVIDGKDGGEDRWIQMNMGQIIIIVFFIIISLFVVYCL